MEKKDRLIVLNNLIKRCKFKKVSEENYIDDTLNISNSKEIAHQIFLEVLEELKSKGIEGLNEELRKLNQ